MSTLTCNSDIGRLRYDSIVAKVFKPTTGKTNTQVFADIAGIRKAQYFCCKRWPGWFSHHNGQVLPHVLSRAEIDEIIGGVPEVPTAAVKAYLDWWTSKPIYRAAVKDRGNSKQRRAEH